MNEFDVIMYDLIDHDDFWEMVSLKAFPKPKPLGEGTKGVAYDIGRNKVLKITEDDTEADASAIVAKKGKVEGVNKIYGVYEWKRYPDYYIIVQDKVSMNYKRATNATEDITNTFVDLYPEKPDDDVFNSRYYTSTRVKEMIDVLSNLNSIYKVDSINLVKGLGNLNKLGITYRDLHAGNIGFDKSHNAVIIDLGYSKSAGGDVKVFEGKAGLR